MVAVANPAHHPLEVSSRKTSKAKPAADKAEKTERANAATRQQRIFSCADTYSASPWQQIEMIRAGLPSSALVETSLAMGITREQLYQMLNFPRATVTRKIAARAPLSREMSERLLGLRKLIGQVEVMVRDCGDSEGFDAARWFSNWLNQSVPALGGLQPSALMDTVAGQRILSELLDRMVSGAYS